MKRTLYSLICFSVLILCVSPCIAGELKTVKLDEPQTQGGKPLMEVLKNRSSSRAFTGQSLSRRQLSNLLWAAFGINRPESGKRTAPSAMNRQEIDVYAALPDGLYLYDAKAHALKQVLADDIRGMAGTQPFVKDAAVNLIYVADFEKMKGVSGEDRMLYAGASAGFIGENVYLYCASEGLAVVIRASMDKPALAKRMGLRVDQRIVLSQSVGYPKKQTGE